MKFLFLTGAGVSANAGIPTYRDNGASWRDPDLERKSHANRYGNHLDELWDKHWGPVSEAMSKAEPTYTHKAIAEFQKRHEVIIATQNIELLHELAGSDNVAHLHGSMQSICMRCKSTDIRPWKGDGHGAPTCRNCLGHKTRPNVILFGENLNAKLFRGLEGFAYHADAVVAVGTSLNVFPAAGLIMDHTPKAYIVNKDKTAFNKFAKKTWETDCDTVIDEVLAELDSLK